MKRLTEQRDYPLTMSMWAGESKDLRIYNRLAEIENILGDDYDLDRLKELVDAGRGKGIQTAHGFWKWFTHSAYQGCDDFGEPIFREVAVYHCSKCNRRTVIRENYCPSCGAKMDLEEK